ncbi:outer membrane protein assembly factor BamA [Lentisalinibacter orientalis]|uniref:outer membrane protein assembly factor BamA n=1 Tax=Lentisalinibacter orientalis TaxID=2992241 RepID=UPI003865ED13
MFSSDRHTTPDRAGRPRLRGGWLLLALALLSTAALTARAEEFVVRDMRVEGLQRISEGTVFNYLPINLGDTLTPQRVREAIRALYRQGLFEDIAFRRDGDTLVIEVQERPSIAEFTIEGNKDIKTEDLTQSLRGVGLARGKTFDRSVLEEVTRFLTEQYYSRGKYGVSVVANVEDRPNNQVAISIDVKEGERARIRQINIVGNEEFRDEEIRDQFELQTPNWLSFIRQDDRYAKESLSGDLESLRSFYMDRGFADFEVESTQVAISPDRKDIYITINVREGERYEISNIKLAGEMVVPREELERLILAKPGETFNLQRLTQTSELISFRLGADGYAQAEVEPVPDLDRENKLADVTIYIEPNNRVYVRRINFNGIDSVADEVLRREMRQMEGGYLSNTLVDRSKVRLQRLPYIEEVQVDTAPVPGTPDLVDVNYDLKYGLPGQFGGGVGYSEAQKLILNGNFVHSNFLGTGNRVQAEINSGRFSTAYSLSYTDPYRTIDGVRRTLSVGYRDITQFTSSASDFSTETITAGIDYGYPITEYQTLSFGLALQDAELVASTFSTQQAQEWVLNNGNPRIEDLGNGNSLFVTDFKTLEMVLGWTYDSRNRAIFADRGTRQRFVVSAAVPGSDVEYYTARYDLQKYFPITRNWIVSFASEFAFGEGINETTALPPYKQFYAGGPGSVRGFAESDLGPVDSFGNPYGGNLLVTSQLELIIPVPEGLRGRTRFSLFYDIGNVFNTGEVAFTDRLGDPITYDFESGELRQSVGIAAEWLAPLGLFRFSYALPLNEVSGTDRIFGDRVERFQFSIGNAF